MTYRKLSDAEVKQISEFISTLRTNITPWQPTESQQEHDAQIPKRIQEQLLNLLPKSVNNHLLSKYLPHLNKSNIQDDLLYWLKSINCLSTKMKLSDKFNNQGLVHQILFREATRLAMETSISFANQSLSVMSKLPYEIAPELLMTLTLEAIASFNTQKNDDIATGKDKEANGAYGYYYETHIDESTLLEQLLAKHPSPLKVDPIKLKRTRSDSAALAHMGGASSLSPLRPHQPITNIHDRNNSIKPRKLF